MVRESNLLNFQILLWVLYVFCILSKAYVSFRKLFLLPDPMHGYD